MFCKYDELKAYVGEDFERFYKWDFHEKQVFPAVLDEYRYVCPVENICIHVAVALKYAENNWSTEEIVEELKGLMNEADSKELQAELGNEYTKMKADLEKIGFCKL